MNYKISIEELENKPSKSIDFHFKDIIEGINSVDKIVADLKITSMGEFIEVAGNVKGTVKLECDLCLKEFEALIHILSLIHICVFQNLVCSLIPD